VTRVRVLFTFAGGTGHFLPLAALAGAARLAGHAVAFAGQDAMVPTVEAAGFEAFASGGATLREPTGRRAPLLTVDLEREARAVRVTFAGRVARERAAALLALCAEWRPDVIVRDEIDFGAAVAAEAAGLPCATVLCIASGSFVPPALVHEPLSELRAARGLPPDPELAMLSRGLVLSPFPPSLRDPGAWASAHAFRLPAEHERADDALVELLTAIESGPVTYLTLGTIFNQESGDLFERALAGLRDLPCHVVVTVGRELDPASLGPQPANVHVLGFVPQSLLLPHVDLVVSHGGSGSLLGALSHGLPMVLLPMGADQPLTARCAEELGVARTLDAVGATPAVIAAAASDVLGDPGFRRRAKLVRDEIAALPGVEHAVGLLEQLAVPGS
jgi:UDP:flavonoid glycosyltransferase YjiC (YdhE family)